MRLTILTPLFPPDTEAPAAYAKALAGQLAHHDVTVIAYGRLPESVPTATIVSINKQQFKVLLIFECIKTLLSTTTDLVVINNGPSSEAPALIYSFLSRTPLLLIESDARAQTASNKGFYRFIHKALSNRCRGVLQLPSEKMYLRPEILPFSTQSETNGADVAAWWKQHIESVISYGKS